MRAINLEYPSTRTLSGQNNIQTALPLGGLGAGGLCINGQGGFQDFSLRNRPELSAMPDGHGAIHDSAFGLIHLRQNGQSETRLLEGPLPSEKIYALGIKGQGYRHGGKDGLPRFEQATFQGSFPFARVDLRDETMPLTASITAWSPFIPGNDRDTGLPVAIAEYTFTNTSDRPVDISFSFHLSHLSQRKKRQKQQPDLSRNRVIPERGIYFYNEEHQGSDEFGNAALIALEGTPKIKAMWFRGGWFDAVSMLWKEVSNGQFHENDGSDCAQAQGWNGGSLCFEATLAPGESRSFPVGIAWYFPNVHFQFGHEPNVTDPLNPQPWWRPWYTTQWDNAQSVALELVERYSELRNRTESFHRALHDVTIPPEIIDALSANLGILKSPTVLRQENGDFWGWEGCFPDRGSCHGNCTHVYNYAQALAHLFPSLERTLRDQEYYYSMDEDGFVGFRFSVPTTKITQQGIPAADGQLGGLMKLYRDWQICGDDAWLETIYPLARLSIEYCIRTWDPDETGGLIKSHHNTYDIQFHGPDGLCGTIYLGALTAMSRMAGYLGKTEDVERYEVLAKKAANILDERLFNGEYYEQEVITDEDAFDPDADSTSLELTKLLQEEGPKYQYGNGCLADGVFGIWLAAVCGLETPIDREHVRLALDAIVKYNFKEDLTWHPNTQRPGYALANEAGLVLCTWPHGGRPSLPFVYSDEAWTGIEYQVASHLIMEGRVEAGLRIVRAVRKRYDGKIRNPWNEYECGSYYARAMASYGLLQAWTGLRYSRVTKTLWLAPATETTPLRTFFACDGCFGTLELRADSLVITLTEGTLELNAIQLNGEDILFEAVKLAAGKPVNFVLPQTVVL